MKEGLFLSPTKQYIEIVLNFSSFIETNSEWSKNKSCNFLSLHTWIRTLSNNKYVVVQKCEKWTYITACLRQHKTVGIKHINQEKKLVKAHWYSLLVFIAFFRISMANNILTSTYNKNKSKHHEKVDWVLSNHLT